jgi:tagaturonate reductase
MNDPIYGRFTKSLMHAEIAPAIPFSIDKKVKEDFANKVFERFCNPFIEHQWQSITVHYTSKMKMRNIPLIQHHYEVNDTVPLHMATGLAGMLLYMKAVKKGNARPDDKVGGVKYYGERSGELYEIKDDSAEYFYQIWQNNAPDKVAEIVLQNEELWDIDLTRFPGLLQTVQEQLNEFLSDGVLNTIARIETKKVVV